MTQHRFGGHWTAEKLQALAAYLPFYTKALKNQGFRLVYIDAFAGTGRVEIRTGPSRTKTIHGSASIALECAPGFDHLHFIERKPKHVEALRSLVHRHNAGSRTSIHHGDARSELPALLDQYRHQWRRQRGVLFLDPYGLQCTWAMVERIADTRALDVFFLVSLSGLYRQAAVNAADVDAGKAAALTRFLGTDEWRSKLYDQVQNDLFGDPLVQRQPGYRDILEFTTGRLREVFSHVADPVLLGTANGAPLFALYFAVSNRSPTAIALAKRVASDILKPLR